MLPGVHGGVFFSFNEIYWGCADALWHETGHRTALKADFGMIFSIS